MFTCFDIPDIGALFFSKVSLFPAFSCPPTDCLEKSISGLDFFAKACIVITLKMAALQILGAQMPSKRRLLHGALQLSA
jgi:hypothetical protein